VQTVNTVAPFLVALNPLIGCGLFAREDDKDPVLHTHSTIASRVVSVCRAIAVCCMARQSYDLYGVSERRSKNLLCGARAFPSHDQIFIRNREFVKPGSSYIKNRPPNYGDHVSLSVPSSIVTAYC
jgi:hypothetical protein